MSENETPFIDVTIKTPFTSGLTHTDGRTTPPPARLGDSELSLSGRERLADAFYEGATSPFTGSKVFDPTTGGISGQFKQSLDENERTTVEMLETKLAGVFDLRESFEFDPPEDVHFFLAAFADMDRAPLTKLLDTPSSVIPTDLRSLRPEILTAMNGSVLAEKLSALPTDTKAALCRHLQGEEADFRAAMKIVRTLDCLPTLQAEGKRPRGSLARAVAAEQMRKKPPREWTRIEWGQAIVGGWFAGLPDDVLKLCPGPVIRNNMENLKPLMMSLSHRAKSLIFEKMQVDFGGFGRLSSVDIETMGEMITDLSLQGLKNLDSAAVRSSIGALRTSREGMDTAQRLQIRRAIKDGHAGRRDRTLMKSLDSNVILANISGIGWHNLDEKSARSFARRIRESKDFAQASDFTTTSVRKMGSVFSGFPARLVRSMDNVQFGQLLNDGDLRGLHLNVEGSRAVMDRIRTEKSGTALTQTDLKNLGENVRGLRQSDVDAMNAGDLAKALNEMKETIGTAIGDMEPATVYSIIKKLESGAGGLAGNLETMGSALRNVPVQKLRAIPDADLGDLTGGTQRDFNCSDETCDELYGRVVGVIGRPGLRNPNMTVSVFTRLGRVMGGISHTDVRSLPPTRALLGIINHLLATGSLSDKDERTLAKKIMYRMGIFRTQTRQCTNNDIKMFGGLLKHFTPDELSSLCPSLCQDITKELGSRNLANVRKEHLRELAAYALNCLGKTVGELSSQDTTTMGELICGLPTERVRDVTSDAMEDTIYNVGRHCDVLDATERKVWMDQAMRKLGLTSANIASVSEVTLVQFGPLVSEFSDAMINNIPDVLDLIISNQETLSSVGADLVEVFSERKERLRQRDTAGFGGDVTSSERQARENRERRFYENLVQSFINTESTGRKKRSTGTLTCDDMQLLGSGVTAMTAAQISVMADDDFLDCASFLGSQTGWDADQLEALLAVALRSSTYGSSSGWTADHVYSVGIIAQSLSTSEITALSDLDIDAMYSIGRHDGWDVTQVRTTYLNTIFDMFGIGI
ncbi:hypothetical protein MAR_029513 [Mya arenaria]|uniref:Uncharacterized protein n=1 Tax=Mya arenaria TaxID=6604 RepID=A0ABY7DL60_MYAAR|nr:hypothetical protein MAR_029513 [Mya arenaria]